VNLEWEYDTVAKMSQKQGTVFELESGASVIICFALTDRSAMMVLLFTAAINNTQTNDNGCKTKPFYLLSKCD